MDSRTPEETQERKPIADYLNQKIAEFRTIGKDIIADILEPNKDACVTRLMALKKLRDPRNRHTIDDVFLPVFNDFLSNVAENIRNAMIEVLDTELDAQSNKGDLFPILAASGEATMRRILEDNTNNPQSLPKPQTTPSSTQPRTQDQDGPSTLRRHHRADSGPLPPPADPHTAIGEAETIPTPRVAQSVTPPSAQSATPPPSAPSPSTTPPAARSSTPPPTAAPAPAHAGARQKLRDDVKQALKKTHPALYNALKDQQGNVNDTLGRLHDEAAAEKIKQVATATKRGQLIKALKEIGVTNPSNKLILETLATTRKLTIDADIQALNLGESQADDLIQALNTAHEPVFLAQESRIQSLSDFAAYAPYSTTLANDTTQLDNMSDTAFQLKHDLSLQLCRVDALIERLTVITNDENSSPAVIAKTEAKLNTCRNNQRAYQREIRKLDTALQDITAARTLENGPARLAHFGDGEADVHKDGDNSDENYEQAKKAVEQYFSPNEQNPVDSPAGGLYSGKRILTTDNFTVTEARHVTHTVNPHQSGDMIKTAVIQTKLKTSSGDIQYRQDFYIPTAIIENFMIGRQGALPPRLPNDNIMQWAIQTINNYQAFTDTAKAPLQILARSLPNECIEALLIVCKARFLPAPAVIGRNINADIDALTKKAVKQYQIGKKHETIGVEMQLSPDPEPSSPRQKR